MTGELQAAIVLALQNDPTLDTMLGRYGDYLAIFGFRPVPQLIGTYKEWPFIICEAAVQTQHLTDKTSSFGEALTNIEVYMPNIGDVNDVNDIASYIYVALDSDLAFTVEGYEVVYNVTSPPVGIDNLEELGRSVQLRTGLRR